MTDHLRSIAQWIRRSLDVRAPREEMGPAARALLDFRNMTGGGPVPLPPGNWTLDDSLTLGDGIHLIGAKKAQIRFGSFDAIRGVGEGIMLEDLHLAGNGEGAAVSVPWPVGGP